MNETINIGILGLGMYNTKQHLPNAANNSSFNLHTLCDLNKEVIEKYKTQYNAQNITTDYKQMLNDPDIEVVAIALTPKLHAKMAVEFLEAGKHVYVEKPLSEDIKEIIEIERLARKVGKNIAIGFNRRFAPSYRDLYEIFKDDKGPIMMTYRMCDDVRDRSALYEDQHRLIEEACHVFDVFNWLARSEPCSVYATEYGRKDDNCIIVEYDNGVTANLFISSSGAFHWPKERIEIVGDNKVAAVEDFVELQTGGVPGMTKKTYAGREYDGFIKGYGQAYEEVGLEFYRYMRRSMGDLMHNSGLIETNPDEEKWTLIGKKYPDRIRIPVNYSCDKGWYNALEHFGKAARDNTKSLNASAIDAARVLAVGLAAIESIDKEMPVKIDRDLWAV